MSFYSVFLCTMSGNYIELHSMERSSRTVQRVYSGRHCVLNLLQKHIEDPAPQVTFKDLESLDFIRVQTLAKHHFLSPVNHKISPGRQRCKTLDTWESLKWETKMFMECTIQQHAKVDLGFSKPQVLVLNLHVNHTLTLMSFGLGTWVQR